VSLRALSWSILGGLGLVLAAAGASAGGDEEPTIEFFYPLVTRRPVVERELEFRFDHEKGREGRVSDLSAAVEFPILPRWQVEIAVPLIFTDPKESSAHTGVGDLEIETKYQVFRSLQPRILVALGLEGRLPTGSERRGLGGEAAIEPFVSAGFGVGQLEVLSEIAYAWNLNAHLHHQREHELSASAAVAWLLHRRFAPLLELTTVTPIQGEDEPDAPVGRTQVYLVPGINVKPLPRTTFRAGVELPVTPARRFDYAVRLGFVWEF
jgi:Putative MetA-pathway of phenol degradation